MRKSDKKIDNSIRQALTELCENHLKDLSGFCWITHTVNYQQFPKSLYITCVFDEQHSLTQFLQSEQHIQVEQRIYKALSQININTKAHKKLVIYTVKDD